MYLHSIQITNFKNYGQADFTFSENVNAVVGDNGSGKTNLLDAIHYLSFCKSYFSAQDQQSVKFDEEFFAIHGEFVGQDDERTRRVSCIYKSSGRKVMKLNQKEYERLSDHIGLFPSIMVAPVDSNLIHGGSELRRKFFDMIISQFDKEYLQSLIAYQKLLAQRNSLLKQMFEQGHYDSSLVQIYDIQMAPLAEAIHTRRGAFLTDIQPIFQKHYDFLADSREEVGIAYQSSLNELPMDELLRRNEQADFRSGFTCAGVHKDDYECVMNGKNVRKYSSQGQQKTFLLALKLTQFDYIFEKKKVKPILLLDDIFDKLDEKRIQKLLYLVGNEHFGQVFLSDTDPKRVERILSAHDISHKIFTIKNDMEGIL
jgi:DNA replication and repair protein RecF